MKRKKLLVISILFLFTFNILAGVNLDTIGVSAVAYPAVYVEPASTIDIPPGSTYTIEIWTDYTGHPEWGPDIHSYQFDLTFNPLVLNIASAASVVNDGIMSDADGFLIGTIDNSAGTLPQTSAFYFTEGDVTYETGKLATVTFDVVGDGDSYITLGSYTKLTGWDFNNWEKYDIVNANTMPNNIGHGYYRNLDVVTHDVAVTAVTALPTSVVQGEFVTIDVDVVNQGTVSETFDVTVWRRLLPIETRTVTALAAGDTEPLTFDWDTAAVAPSTYTIVAEASVVAGETDTVDNTFTDGDVTVRGKWNLTVNSVPISGVDFTVDGAAQSTPYSEILVEGSNVVVMPATWTVGTDVYNFVEWEDTSTDLSRTVILAANTTIINATYVMEVEQNWTLTVNSVPSGVGFTVDDAAQSTPYSESLVEGSHVVVMPATWTVGTDVYNFVEWEDTSTDLSRTVILAANTTISIYHRRNFDARQQLHSVNNDQLHGRRHRKLRVQFDLQPKCLGWGL